MPPSPSSRARRHRPIVSPSSVSRAATSAAPSSPQWPPSGQVRPQSGQTKVMAPLPARRSAGTQRTGHGQRGQIAGQREERVVAEVIDAQVGQLAPRRRQLARRGQEERVPHRRDHRRRLAEALAADLVRRLAGRQRAREIADPEAQERQIVPAPQLDLIEAHAVGHADRALGVGLGLARPIELPPRVDPVEQPDGQVEVIAGALAVGDRAIEHGAAVVDQALPAQDAAEHQP